LSLYDIAVTGIDGSTRSMAEFRGQALLVVNVASNCGFTPQYAGLQALYEANKDKGFAVLGFPCDQFGHQEPGTEPEIQSFCDLNYGVTFPLFAKVDVNGANAHPLFAFLKSARPGLLGTEAIKWNFTKFLVGKDGTVLKRYAPTDTPDAIAKDVAPLLG
jgi:glutathione peroxidase